MDNILKQMVDRHEVVTVYDKKNRMKEVIQEIVLCGLSRGGFFKNAAFYGGTALRIFYGLDRFSEDLDFSLKKPDEKFDFGAFLPILEKEIRSYGLNFKVEEKKKTRDSDIRSAFVKGNTKEHMLIFFPTSTQNLVASNEAIKVKFEVDTNPPAYASYENKYQLLPIPYQVTLYDMPSLFAGKLHAVLCRGWKDRVKGRDLYDYVFYLSKMVPLNIKHLQARLAQTGHVNETRPLTLRDVKDLLQSRFSVIDFEQAKQDVMPFIKNADMLDMWSKEFFLAITENLRI